MMFFHQHLILFYFNLSKHFYRLKVKQDATRLHTIKVESLKLCDHDQITKKNSNFFNIYL